MDEFVSFITQPPMSPAAAAEVVAQRPRMGNNYSKSRGVFQNSLIDEWSKLDSDLGHLVQEIELRMQELDDANKFGGFNEGIPTDDAPPSIFHHDKSLELKKKPKSRIVFNFNSGHAGGGAGEADKAYGVGLTFRITELPEIQYHVTTPHGCALVFNRRLAECVHVEHAHGGSGDPNLSLIYDVRGDVNAATPEEIAASAVLQLPLNFLELCGGEWDQGIFQGKDQLRKGGIGGGSQRRMAVGLVAGPPTGGRGSRRAVPLRKARARVAAMSEEEIAEAAYAVASAMGA